MKYHINHKFDGIINGVHIDNETLYYSLQYILDEFETHFGVLVPYTLVEDLKYALSSTYEDISETTVGEIEYEIVSSFHDATSIKKVNLDLWGYGKYQTWSKITKKLSNWDKTYAKDDVIKL